jgi:hypothetical protein
MADPITIPLSPYQQARFAAYTTEAVKYEAEAKRLRAILVEVGAMLLSGLHPELTDVAHWQIECAATEIRCTPPTEQPEVPSA